MNLYKTTFCVIVLCLSLIPVAVADTESYELIVDRGVTQHARPAYAKLIVRTKALEDEIGAACAGEPDLVTPDVIASFHEAAKAWESVSHLRWGPASRDYRYGRMFFGADPAGFAWKKLAILLYTQNKTVLELDSFRQQSTAIQGFTALEYLLFEPMPLPNLDAYQCGLSKVIAENMHQTALEIAAGWQDGSDYITNLNTPDPEHPFVQNELEAAMQFFKPLAGGMSYMIAVDLKTPLQGDAQSAKSDTVNYGRSGLGRDAILAKLSAFEDLYRYAGFAEALAPRDLQLHNKIMAGFGKSKESLRQLDLPLKEAVKDNASRVKVKNALNEIESLWHVLVYDMAEQFGFVVGFNTFDGD